MATKTISIDMEAYERLRAARLSATESFSKVIRRAKWPAQRHTAEALIAASEDAPVIDDETLAGLDAAQRDDRPPEDPWASG
jgi:predicted CopG family antitoxin